MRRICRFGVAFLAFLLLIQPIYIAVTATDDTPLQVEDSTIIGQQMIPWRFVVYDEPNFRAPVRGAFDPQMVNIVRQQADGWALIRTWRGNVWVYIRDNLRFLTRPMPIFDRIGGPSAGTIAPQVVRILSQDGTWLQISTWLGPRFVNIQGMPAAPTPEPPTEEFIPPPSPGEARPHFIPWRFATYLEPDFRTTVQDFYNPQIVDVVEVREDGWARIATWRGDRWVYLTDNRLFIDRDVTLHDTRGGPAVGRLSSQVVRILDQAGDWFQISTWLGPRWIFLGRGPAPTPGTKRIALTFDDGPHPVLTARLLDALAARGVVATFYVLGSQVSANPQLTARIVREGHELGNHSYSHPVFTRMGAAGVRTELVRTQDAIRQATGTVPATLRPPYGAQNAMVRSVAAELGYPLIMWSVDTRDWESRNVNAILSHFVDAQGNIRIRDGDIILMHDVHPTTIDAAIRAVDILLSAGFTFVTVSDLLDSPAGGTVIQRAGLHAGTAAEDIDWYQAYQNPL